MPAGGTLTIGSRMIRLPRSSPKATHVVVDFQDTGQGMSAEQRRRAFTSVLHSSKAKGTGLGLAIVARVIETHRGQVKIKSLQGKGTTVSVFLPM
jgi:signal transduction histidine kinase